MTMSVDRRRFLQAAALVAASVPLSGCEHVVSLATQGMGETIPAHVAVPQHDDIDEHFHLLSRAAYGPWPGELEYLKKIGAHAWLDEQLAYDKIKDDACQFRAKRFETIHLDPGTCFEYKRPVLQHELAAHSIVRAVYSKRQLYEVMVGFWSDHLNISINKGDCLYFKPSDDRLVIRPHALGNFRDLIHASVLSPAMLVYLDGKENKKPTADSIPNENAARELLELHTLGVRGGYTQKDVYETARCLTGWTIQTGWQRGKENFQPTLHDNGEKTVLGHRIDAGLGEKDLDRVLDIICYHPSTAQHIATKLVHRFVSDEPPPPLVSKLADIFTRTKGEIKPMLLALFTSKEFADARGEKLKRPFHYVVSALRMTGADTYAHEQMIEYISRMGQGPFSYPTPDGYPDKPEPWLGTMLWRWNFASALVSNTIPSVQVALPKLVEAVKEEPASALAPMAEQAAIAATTATVREADVARWFAYFSGRRPSAKELKALQTFAESEHKGDASAALIGIILSSPAFQRC
jgi:uncharacterized protein (DUF1800 family)